MEAQLMGIGLPLSSDPRISLLTVYPLNPRSNNRWEIRMVYSGTKRGKHQNARPP